jgi:ABC-type lipoprotein release transport system permease subunit
VLAHALVTAVRRRRRDLAIPKTIGMRKAQLLTVVSWQATALTIAALTAGIPLGILAVRKAAANGALCSRRARMRPVRC